jgi:hypothetical protein
VQYAADLFYHLLQCPCALKQTLQPIQPESLQFIRNIDSEEDQHLKWCPLWFINLTVTNFKIEAHKADDEANLWQIKY